MWIERLRRELQELSQECSRAARDEERATFELTRSARAFSQRAREAADDKLAFSATLMRAGEVGAAQRLINDLEQDVRGEQAALTKKVDAIEAVASTRRATKTRLRLARALAAVVLIAGLFSFSVAGIAVASFLKDLSDHPGDGSSARTGSHTSQGANPSPRDAAMRSIRFPDGTSVTLTQAQFRQFKRLSSNPNLGRQELERLLIDLVGPTIAARLASSVFDIADGPAQATGDAGPLAGDVESKVKKELDSRPDVTKPSTPAPGSDGHEPRDAPREPNDDSGVIDVPLDTEPKTPPVLDGD
jgi:hypothetical protein